eukprot:c4736_g1_i2.p1 GENE.c4736_g1_i2~~c4736_g1_i2.p1  ORF type:complete len:247 (+),score=48.93 c4736_g1_i2:636-1376(+)
MITELPRQPSFNHGASGSTILSLVACCICVTVAIAVHSLIRSTFLAIQPVTRFFLGSHGMSQIGKSLCCILTLTVPPLGLGILLVAKIAQTPAHSPLNQVIFAVFICELTRCIGDVYFISQTSGISPSLKMIGTHIAFSIFSVCFATACLFLDYSSTPSPKHNNDTSSNNKNQNVRTLKHSEPFQKAWQIRTFGAGMCVLASALAFPQVVYSITVVSGIFGIVAWSWVVIFPEPRGVVVPVANKTE